MNIEFTAACWIDFNYWLDNDAFIAAKIRELIKSIQQDPFKGIGKPEPLKQNLKGFWSRRINHEHRLIYFISGTKGTDQKCTIIQCKFHY